MPASPEAKTEATTDARVTNRASAMRERMPAALKRGVDPQFIHDAVDTDAQLDEGARIALHMYLDALVAEKVWRSSDRKITEAIAAAYAAADTDTGRRLEAEAAATGYVQRQRTRFGY